MRNKLGKRPARDALVYKFTDVFDPLSLPKPPLVFGHQALVPNFGMLGNDQWGDCVWAGSAHNQFIWSAEGGNPVPPITIKEVLSDYAAVTGFNYTEDTDQGTDIVEAAQYFKNTGILDAKGHRHKIDAYVALKVGNLDELFLAMWLFGAVGIGLNLTESAEFQSDANGEGKTGVPWILPTPVNVIGGHYVSGVGRDDQGNIVIVTWGTIQTMTPEYFEHLNDESVAYLSLEALNAKNLSPEGYDATFLQELMGKL